MKFGKDILEIDGNIYERILNPIAPCICCCDLFFYCYSHCRKDEMLCESDPEQAKRNNDLHCYVKIKK